MSTIVVISFREIPEFCASYTRWYKNKRNKMLVISPSGYQLKNREDYENEIVRFQGKLNYGSKNRKFDQMLLLVESSYIDVMIKFIKEISFPIGKVAFVICDSNLKGKAQYKNDLKVIAQMCKNFLSKGSFWVQN